jgi:uncharacterized protein
VRTQSQSAVPLADVIIAMTPAARTTGLLNHSSLQPGDGLLIPSARAIHTRGMQFPIDIAFLKNGVVVGVVHNMQPGGQVQCPTADSALELPSGRLRETNTQVGDTVRWAQTQFDSVTYPSGGGIGATQIQRRPRSLGQMTTAGTAAVIAQSGATATSGILGALSAAASGGSIAGPVGLAITGAITLGVAIYNMFKGCGATCTEATSLVNQAAPLLQQNLTNYLSAPVRYASFQAAALNNFDTVWAALVQACETAGLSTAGQNCVADRQEGACAYKTSPGGWVQNSDGTCTYTGAGPNGSGTTCWNWFVGYRDPIANDPCVQPDPTVSSATGAVTAVGTAVAGATSIDSTGAATAAPSSLMPLLVGAAILALLVMED